LQALVQEAAGQGSAAAAMSRDCQWVGIKVGDCGQRQRAASPTPPPAREVVL
jgi:hypothetical protein